MSDHNPFRSWVIGVIHGLAQRLYVWAICAAAAHRPRRLVEREVKAVPETVDASLAYQNREQETLTVRLSRRYDIGMAMNEAANRAMADKATARLQLTPQQEAALKVQQDYLQRVVNQA